MNSTPQASQGALRPKAARGIMAALIQWGLSADNILLLFGSVWLGSVLFCSVFFLVRGGGRCVLSALRFASSRSVSHVGHGAKNKKMSAWRSEGKCGKTFF